MATDITMPKLGFDMEEGAISSWLKSVGEEVKKGEPIAEVETDKATVEMEAPADGALIEILVQPGERVPVGTVVGRIGAPGEAPAAEATPAAEAPPPAPAPADEAQATSAEAERATEAEAPPDEAGRVRASPVARRLAEERGVDLSRITGTGPGGRITREDVEAYLGAPKEEEPTPPGGVKASPAARRIAAERGIDLSQVKGTGPGGRIVVADVEAFRPAEAPAPAPTPAPAAAPAAPAPAVVTPTPVGAAEEVELTRMRRRIAEVMTSSKAPIPHFYVTMAIDMEQALAEREKMNAALAEEEIKISVNDLIVKAAALALRKFPNINASFAGDKIVRHGDINIGIAVALETGLITVVVRNADQKTLSQISQETRAKAARAREGKLQPDDLGGSTFTISNLGMYGVEDFIAVITPPEAAILAVGAAQKVPVVRDDQIVIGHVMRATISADHRVTDGAEAAEFMVELKRLLENPLRLML